MYLLKESIQNASIVRTTANSIYYFKDDIRTLFKYTTGTTKWLYRPHPHVIEGVTGYDNTLLVSTDDLEIIDDSTGRCVTVQDGLSLLNRVIIHNEKVLVNAGHGQMGLFNLNTLSLEWKRELMGNIREHCFAADNILYTAKGDILYALSLADGSLLWELDLKKEIRHILAFHHDMLWVQVRSGTIILLHPLTRAIVKTIADMPYVQLDTSRNKLVGIDKFIYHEIALDTHQVVNYSLNMRFIRNGISVSQPLNFTIDQDYLYFVSTSDRITGVMSRMTFQILWQYQFDKHADPTTVTASGNSLFVSDAIAERLYVFTK